MIDWTVRGVDSTSGQERIIEVNAFTEDEAIEAAKAMGVVAKSITEGGLIPDYNEERRPKADLPPPCPVCGSHVYAVKRMRGSLGVAILLLIAGGLPGLLYCWFYYGEFLACPRCNGIRSKVLKA